MKPHRARDRIWRAGRRWLPAWLGLASQVTACSTSEDPPVGGAGGSNAGNPAAQGAGTASGGALGGTAGTTMAMSGAGASTVSSGGGAGISTGGSNPVPSGGAPADDRSAEGICARWRADTADLSEGTWSGAVETCTAGDISADGRANALRLFNLVRWLADLPAVTTEAARDEQAQACALLMTANDALSHEPPEDWECYSELGAQGARTSNISSGPGVSSVLLYMVDRGNETTFGHRRIILSNELGPIGLGSTGRNGSSCMQNIGGKGNAGKAWIAWPPPGPFPMQAYEDGFSSLDDTGWSIQSKAIDLSAAQVSVTSGGEARAVQVEPLSGNYGNNEAIRIVPDGWQAQPGATYVVSVAGISPPITYEIQLIDCK